MRRFTKSEVARAKAFWLGLIETANEILDTAGDVLDTFEEKVNEAVAKAEAAAVDDQPKEAYPDPATMAEDIAKAREPLTGGAGAAAWWRKVDVSSIDQNLLRGIWNTIPDQFKTKPGTQEKPVPNGQRLIDNLFKGLGNLDLDKAMPWDDPRDS